MKLSGFNFSSSCALLLILLSSFQHVSAYPHPSPDESLKTDKVGPGSSNTSTVNATGSASNMGAANNSESLKTDRAGPGSLTTSTVKASGSGESASNMGAATANNSEMDDDGGGGSTEGSANATSLKPIMLDVTDADIFRIPARRPHTKYEAGKSREFIPVRIVPSDSPCIYQKFLHFFRHAAQLGVKPVDLLRRAVVNMNDTENYFYDPEDLCILIDDELNIDIYQYDCTTIGTCTCGVYYDYVDPNMPQPEPIDNEIVYMAVNGLDRKLMVEEKDRSCVSGLAGHCSLENSSALEKLYCKSSLECVLDDTYGPILTNQATQETYGVCLRKKPNVKSRNNFSAADYKRIIDAQ